jgi:hypothetical protein
MDIPDIIEAEDIKECERLQDLVTKSEHYTLKCIEGGEYVFYYGYEKALIPGHIYSEDGLNEYHISRCCEYHFDEMFAEDEDPPTDLEDDSPVSVFGVEDND